MLSCYEVYKIEKHHYIFLDYLYESFRVNIREYTRLIL